MRTMEKRPDYLPYGRQHIDDDDIEAVVNVLKGDYLTTGPAIDEFEKTVAGYVDAKYAVAFCNGTAALHGACFAAGISVDDEVITTPMTFAASANCALYVGAKPVFADIDENTYNIDPEDIKRKLTSKTRAIIPVHYTGQSVDLDCIHKIAKENNLVVIEDAAHALGSKYNKKKIGALSDMTMFSFHPVKAVTAGEGGVITTDNKEFYDKLIQFRTHGITRDYNKLSYKDESNMGWYYEQQFLGYNYRMTDIQAALGTSQMKKLDLFIEKRKKLVCSYNKLLRDIDGTITPIEASYSESAYHLYVVQVEPEKFGITRAQLFNYLRGMNIGVNVHYIPVYYHPYYKKLGYVKGICPKAEALYENIISLPLYPDMTYDDVQYVVECIKNAKSQVKNS